MKPCVTDTYANRYICMQIAGVFHSCARLHDVCEGDGAEASEDLEDDDDHSEDEAARRLADRAAGERGERVGKGVELRDEVDLCRTWRTRSAVHRVGGARCGVHTVRS